jgi:hypothetical protein
MTVTRELIEVPAESLTAGDRDGHLGVGRRVLSTRTNRFGQVEVLMAWSNGRKDRATLDPQRKLKVKRSVVGAGKPLRHRGVSKATRAVVEVWDTDNHESRVTREAARGHRWAMRCVHGTVVGRPTLDAALEDVHDPRLWCVECA